MLSLFAPFLASMVRHALTLAAGFLVQAHLLPANDANGFVAACLLFAGIGWSCWQKINQPGVLAQLQDRAAAKNVKAKTAMLEQYKAESTKSPFNLNPSALVIAGLAIAALLAVSMPASAQVLWQEPVKHVKPHKAKKSVERMNAGLLGLLPDKSPLDDLFNKVRDASIADLEYAKALADGVKDSPAAAQRSKCYGAWLGLLATMTSVQAVVAGAPAPEKPGAAHLFTRFEQLSQTADSLAPMSTFQVACAPVAQAMRMNISQFVLSVVGGGLSLGKLGVLP